jgi:hypothetical protein
MREAYTWYKLNYLHFNKPLLEVFLHRYHMFQMVFTVASVKEIVMNVLLKSI